MQVIVIQGVRLETDVTIEAPLGANVRSQFKLSLKFQFAVAARETFERDVTGASQVIFVDVVDEQIQIWKKLERRSFH